MGMVAWGKNFLLRGVRESETVRLWEKQPVTSNQQPVTSIINKKKAGRESPPACNHNMKYYLITSFCVLYPLAVSIRMKYTPDPMFEVFTEAALAFTNTSFTACPIWL